MRILVTGATGFAGGWLAEELTNALPAAALFGTTLSGGERLDMRLLLADLTDSAAVRQVVAEVRPTHVFHLAGFASGAGVDTGAIRRANVDVTVDLLTALRDVQHPCRVLLASSGYVYGPTSRPACEDDPRQPAGAYAESKAAMEDAARGFAGDVLAITVARAFNHTGPRQTDAFAVPAFARQIARIERGLEPPVVKVGNLDAVRDFLDVCDVVRAYRQLLTQTVPEPWRVVNVASGVGITIRSVLDSLIARATVPVSVEIDPARLRQSDLPASVGDPARLTALTGWTPQRPLSETLDRTLTWWRHTR